MKKNASFWNETESIDLPLVQQTIGNEIIHLNETYTHNQLEQRMNDLLWGIESSDFQKAMLMEEYMKLQQLWKKEFSFDENQDVIKINLDMIKAQLINLDNKEVIEMRLDFILPYYSKNVTNRTAYYARLKQTYQQPIIKVLRDLPPEFSLKEEKCFVLISQYMPNYIIRDLDNRFHSFIFNALRASNIITNDDWQNLSYMENGYLASREKGFTNILVGREDLLTDMIKYNEDLSK